ncbi:hypothetical protein [Microbulbifer sp. S227A]|uniref:hypothetical protein n=1 Tax=Microbulbifer sp. S227A TaxID=3415131 RepID=UPI003C7A94FF
MIERLIGSMARCRVAALVLATVATPLTAQQVSVPQGCEPIVTVAKKSCIATTIFDCGSHFEEAAFSHGQPAYTHVFNADWAFVEYRLGDDLRTIEIGFDDGRSITLPGLLEHGSATSDRPAVIGSGALKGLKYRLHSEAALGDETLDLSGHSFRKGTLHRGFVRQQGENSLDFEFDIYVSEELNLFIEGAYSRKTAATDPEWLEQSPLSLYFPGDPGFLSTQLDEGCDG